MGNFLTVTSTRLWNSFSRKLVHHFTQEQTEQWRVLCRQQFCRGMRWANSFLQLSSRSLSQLPYWCRKTKSCLSWNIFLPCTEEVMLPPGWFMSRVSTKPGAVPVSEQVLEAHQLHDRCSSATECDWFLLHPVLFKPTVSRLHYLNKNPITWSHKGYGHCHKNIRAARQQETNALSAVKSGLLSAAVASWIH